jgi:hypothetical protein
MRAPQAHTRGSTSKIFLSRRAQVLRACLEKSELSRSRCVIATALRTANPGETSPQPPAVEKCLHRAQRPRAGLEAVFVLPHITVEVSLEQLIEPGVLGLSWPVGGGRFRKDAAAGILSRIEAVLGRTGPGDDRLVTEGHVAGSRPPRGLRAAIDLTVTAGFEPRFRGSPCALHPDDYEVCVDKNILRSPTRCTR